MKKKWVIIAVIFLIVCVLAGFFLLREEPPMPTTQTPTTPATPTITPKITPTVESSGVIKITSEKLISNLMAEPNKYKAGTVFRVSGIVEVVEIPGSYGYATIYLGPRGINQGVVIANVGARVTEEQISLLKKIQNGKRITVQGYYPGEFKGVLVSLYDVSIISLDD